MNYSFQIQTETYKSFELLSSMKKVIFRMSKFVQTPYYFHHFSVTSAYVETDQRRPLDRTILGKKKIKKTKLK